MMDHAVGIAHEIKANAMLVCVDVISDASTIDDVKKEINFIMVSREDEIIPDEMKKNAQILYIPNVNLTRVGKIKIAIAKGIVLAF